MIASSVGLEPTRGTFASRSGATLDISIAVYRSPAGGAQVGGDWCEVIPISEQAIVLTIGDVSGHGKAVAGRMAAARASVMRALCETVVPSEILSIANDVALRRGDDLLVTAIVAVLDKHLRTLTFANAGHPPPLLLVGGRHTFVRHPSADFPLGLFPCHHAANISVVLPPDALLAFYTDGITEHDRDPIRGEAELIEAARLAYSQPEIDAAGFIACHVFEKGRGDDDASAIVLRTLPERSVRSHLLRTSLSGHRSRYA